MMRRKSYKIRLYPTKRQKARMSRWLECCRWLYNHFLEQRKTSWETEKKCISLYDQISTITKLREIKPELSDVYSQILQNIGVRVELTFQSFFRRVKRHEKSGYPRFRGKERYNSFTYPQNIGFEIRSQIGKIRLGKIGSIKFRNSIDIECQPKTCTISRSPIGKWYASISCEILEFPTTIAPKEVTGIDLGLESFLTYSDGSKVENPRFFRSEERSLVKAQRKLSKLEKIDIERPKVKKVVSRIHERIKNKRTDFAHKLSHKIVQNYGIIFVEDLSINRMVHNRCLSKSISDVAWSQFLNYLTYKAEWAGKQVIRINPAYTSQTCSNCGHREPKSLGDRIHKCFCCGFTTDRDHNAALNILALGLQSLGKTKSLEA